MKLASVCLLIWTLDHLLQNSNGSMTQNQLYFDEEPTEDDIETPLSILRDIPFIPPPIPIKKNIYGIENLQAECKLKNSQKLEILWTYSGNISEDSYVLALWYHGNTFGYFNNLQNVSTESQHRYYLLTEEVHKYMDVVYFDVFPCKTCRRETVKCELKIEVSWLPLWTSISDIDRLVYEGRHVLAFWALVVKFSQWAAMILVLFEIHRDITRGIRWPWQIE
ncbi:membrane glycoprotein US11 [Cercopithecine betaherpesvirus 5]|uniref:Membrane glycoprotein US11 n=1 Tax=Simian cytomegalovirus (strain Colburn) TaxID=50292 RepID=G8XTL6_SCMVC|nr:membrane glycoprotein US11 [Cercopithecine betaherpesvirus 5]AEV80508.1 membrane glycoprotein US11 [Cercopithecine betaherpesvirus 5]